MQISVFLQISQFCQKYKSTSEHRYYIVLYSMSSVIDIPSININYGIPQFILGYISFYIKILIFLIKTAYFFIFI